MNDLELARRNIDTIDREMAALFARRLEEVRQVAAYKQANNLPVFDAAREAQVLANRTEAVPEDIRTPYRQFLQGVMDASKTYQYALLGDTVVGRSRVHIERGALRQADLFDLDRKVLIVTDDGVPPQYADGIAAQCKSPFRFVFPHGEENKTLQTAEKILQTLQVNEFTRADCIVTVGGGVVGDVGGFAASCYMRGIDFYNVPTTLLSQADASVGGKTAVNLGGIKNSVGAFYPPKAVLIDPETLRTLPQRRIADGIAEIIKEAVTLDGALFAALESGKADTETALRRAVQLKKNIVEQDMREQNLRRVLNFGHTVGHAIESVSGLYHGESVALGMLPMCTAEVRTRLISLYQKWGLPAELPVPKEMLFAALRHDKKRVTDSIAAVFSDAVGSYVIRKVPLSAIEQRIRETW